MPVYEYECNDCQKVFEIQQRMSDDPLSICPECEGSVRKLMSMSSFHLKGGGWYADGYASKSGKAEAKPKAKSSSDSAPACPSGGGCAGCPASSAS